MQMSDTERQPGDAGPWSKAGHRFWQVLLLFWALGIFYHYYHSRGFFELVGQVVGQGP